MDLDALDLQVSIHHDPNVSCPLHDSKKCSPRPHPTCAHDLNTPCLPNFTSALINPRLNVQQPRLRPIMSSSLPSILLSSPAIDGLHDLCPPPRRRCCRLLLLLRRAKHHPRYDILINTHCHIRCTDTVLNVYCATSSMVACFQIDGPWLKV